MVGLTIDPPILSYVRSSVSVRFFSQKPVTVDLSENWHEIEGEIDHAGIPRKTQKIILSNLIEK